MLTLQAFQKGGYNLWPLTIFSIIKLKTAMNMSKVLPQDRLDTGIYALLGEIRVSKDNAIQSNIQNSFEKSRVVSELYDGFGNKKTESFVNFIVISK